MNDSFVAAIMTQMGRIVAPLQARLSDPSLAVAFLRELGWDGIPQNAIPTLNALETAVTNLQSAAANYANASDDDARLIALADLVVKFAAVVLALRNAGSSFTDATLPAGFSAAIGKQLRDFLIIEYIRTNQPFTFTVLRTIEAIAPRADAKSLEFHPGVALDFLKNPTAHLGSIYQWGQAGVLTDKLFEALGSASNAIGVPAGIYIADPDTVTSLTGIPSPTFAERGRELRVTLLEVPSADDGYFNLSVSFLALAASGGQQPGIGIAPHVIGELREAIPLGGLLALTLTGSVDAGVAIQVRPSGASTAASFAGELKATVSPAVPSAPTTILDVAGVAKLTLASFEASAGLSVGTGRPTDLYFQVMLEQLALSIRTGEADGFLSKILPELGIDASVDLSLIWSSARGIVFAASGGLDITIPIHRAIGPVTLEELFIGLHLTDSETSLRLAISATCLLGPISAAVQRVGAEIPFTFPDDGGNLGPLQIDTPSFLLPTGVALGLETSGLVGGGILRLEPPTYVGGLQLRFSDLGLTAVGIITTELPSGDGFALLIAISIEFSPSIPLSFGFSLAGVGGLIATNRTLSVDALRSGLRTHALDAILFPENLARDALHIISVFQEVAPVQEGRYVFGPMARITWGSPPLLIADIGIFLEVPSPIRIVLLGQIGATIPNPDNVIVELHLDILGVLEFSKRSLSIDATIWGFIKSYPLSGDSALRLTWGDNPQFAMSLGGFHPRFSPPPNFPSLRRLTLNLSSSSSLQISASCYNALTSNSLQFGAHLGFLGRESGASCEGHLAFDALFYFSPFHFSIEMSASVRAAFNGHTVASVSLGLALSGPTPWNANGHASFSILWWDVSVHFNCTWGSDENDTIPAIDPWVPFQAELARPASWSAVLPAGREMVESLRSIEVPSNGEPPLVLHPLGTLEITLDTLGNAPVRDHDSCTIADIETVLSPPAGTPLDVMTPVTDHFARGQFQDLTESQKVSLPSFEKLVAGFAVEVSTPRIDGSVEPCPLEYDSILIGENRISAAAQRSSADWSASERAVSAGAARKGRPTLRGRGRFGVPGAATKVDVTEEGYTIVSATDLAPAVGVISAPRVNDGMLTRLEADQALETYVAAHPDEDGDYIVVCAVEAAA